jgi:hypothetical protein
MAHRSRYSSTNCVGTRHRKEKEMDTRIAVLRFAKAAVFGVGLAMSSLTALAHTLPEGSDLDSLEAATDASERITRMNRLETHRIGAGLQEKAVFKLNEAQLEASGLSPSERALALNRGPFRAFPYAAQPELRSVGTVNTLTVLIDFWIIERKRFCPA